MLEEAETFYASAPQELTPWLAGLGLAQTIAGADAHAGPAMIVHPADGQTLLAYPDADLRHVHDAVAAAAGAFPDWSSTSWDERRVLLERFADALWEHRQTLTYLVAAETGRPLRRAFSEIFFSVDYVRTIAAQHLAEVDYSRAGIRARLVHRPLGVAVAIAPWNGPVILAVAKLANALLAGDTLVLRPAPQTPLSALYLGMLGRDIFPAGVLNVVTGDAAVGAALVEHPDVAKISFTGSTDTGRKIAAAAAPGLKRLTLELGGNDAAIVLADADPEAVANAVYRISLENAGQFCAAIKRLYVHESLYDEVRDRVCAMAQTAVAGSAFDPASTLAPLQSAAQRARVQGFVDDAVGRGASVIGPALEGGGEGFFLPPVLVEGCQADFAIVAEEQFGPALPIMAFTDEAEVLAAANANQYGLGGSVWSSDVERAIAIAEKMRCGTAWVNQHGAFSAALPMPFAGQSGIGMDYAHFGVAEHSRAMLINAKL
ncbi:aldehyde dehydrogenase family protein [Blastomonas sp.]|uniref:aldehyde dehydrogenase family protein n=1 Tax=Blastomonas sp. TaxID=1909299 RepID=UPI003918B1A3